jgi:hypothetical protein
MLLFGGNTDVDEENKAALLRIRMNADSDWQTLMKDEDALFVRSLSSFGANTIVLDTENRIYQLNCQ